jgi:hypothetical protein
MLPLEKFVKGQVSHVLPHHPFSLGVGLDEIDIEGIYDVHLAYSAGPYWSMPASECWYTQVHHGGLPVISQSSEISSFALLILPVGGQQGLPHGMRHVLQGGEKTLSGDEMRVREVLDELMKGGLITHCFSLRG